LKWEALFQIFIIVFSIFSVININPVAAQPVAEQKSCCEKTISGDFCTYAASDQCDPNFKSASTSCEQTSFCKLGCGFDLSEGRCYKNTPRATCNGRENCTWDDSAVCDVPNCQLGCCILSGEASFVTEARCKLETSRLPNVKMTFDASVQDEVSCINLAKSQDKGACVKEDGTCQFTTRETCNAQDLKLEQNATTLNPNFGFHSGMLCSNPLLGTKCAAQQYTGCLPDQDGVYWFDSCGNPENIYTSNKQNSFNNGYVLDKEKSCKLNGAYDKSCGNCEFAAGTLCGNAPNDEKPSYGQYTCIDLNCPDITKEPTVPSSQTPKKLGESWCAYDSLVGFGLDPIGSRHSRRLCINGQELIEACKDYREEMCIQGVQGQPPLGLQQTTKATGNYIEAACRNNRWQTCNDVKKKDDCENIAFRDCIWAATGEGKGTCMPFVPPGLKFWPEEVKDEKAAPPADAKATCNKANQECTVKWEKGGISGGWECVENCHCLKKNWLEAANDLCKAQGDCGAYVNYIGKATTEGLKENQPDFNIKEKDLAKFDSIFKPNDNDREKTFGNFFKKGFLPVFVIALASGIVTGALVTGSTFGAGFYSGATFLEATGAWIGAGGETFGSTAVTAFGAEAGSLTTTTATVSVAPEAAFPVGATIPQTAVYAEGIGGAALSPAEPLIADGLMVNAGTESIPVTAPVVPGATFLGTALMIINFIALAYLTYMLVDILFAKDRSETYTVTCNPWVAPTGGKDCEKCGKDGKPCSEYRCKSLGQLCRIVNDGTTEEKCINTHPNDVNSPTIKALKSVMDSRKKINEVLNKGFEIVEKIEPFSPVTLGIATNEPSICKFALNSSVDFNAMPHDFGDSLYLYNHSIIFSLPSELAEEQALKLTNGGNYQLFVRCQDANGNANDKDYYIRFGIKPGPDLTPPKIEITSIANNGFVPFNSSSTSLIAYTNEPSECRWDATDTDFENMQNNFVCSTKGFNTKSIYYGLYDCSTILEGIKDNQVNNYYFRCKDQPNEKDNSKRNINTESYKYTLIGTLPLVITNIGPVGEVFVNNPTLKVTTAGGAENGKAVCGYSTDGNINNAIDFFKTGSTLHEQPLDQLPAGNYNPYVTCVDKAGNIATKTTSFKVSVDLNAPIITQVYTKGSLLHLTMSEDTTCEYSTKGEFSFGSGTRMTGDNTKDHEAPLDSNIYYVRCKDIFNNLGSYKIYP